MATREENLKKINDELEKLDDEELEKVAGGFYARSNGGDVKHDVTADEVANIFSKYGVSVDQSCGAVSNVYKY